MNMQPVTTESADRLTIKPAVTIGNSILETFPEETQRRRFPNSMLQKPSAYLIQITSKSKDNNSSSQYVKFGRFHNLDANCSNAEVYHPTVNQTLKRSSNESRIPKPLKLSDSLVRSLQLFQQKNISLKNFGLQSVNNRDKTRKKMSGSNPDCASKQSNTCNVDATIMILGPSKKDRYVTEKNISKSKNSNIRTVIEISSKIDMEYQNGDKIKRTPTKLENNTSNKNDIDNTKTIHRSKNITVEATKNIYEEIVTENPLMVKKKSTDTVTQRIDNLICKFIKAKHMVCRQSDSTEVSIKPIYTTSKITTVTNDANINRNFNMTDVGNSKILRKNQHRRHGSAYQKYYDKYLRNLITSSTMKAEKRNMLENVTGFIYSDVFNNTHGQSNLRENYIETKNNNPNKENFFGYEVKKDSKVSNYYNKYLKHRVTPSKRTAPVTVSTTKIEEYNMTNMKYDRGQKAVLSVLEEMSATAKPNKNDYSSIKTEKLLYELKSPKAEIRHRYFPTINVNDVNMISNLSTSNHNATQQNQSNEKYNKTHKQSNISFEKCCDENLIQSNEKIDSGLINSDETPESIPVENTNTISKELHESREILEEKSEDDFDVVLFNFTTTRVPEIVTRDANEPREKTSTERHGKRKHKSRHNGRKNNRPKKRRKNHAKRKRKPTLSVAWKIDEPTSVDYGNAYSSERVKTLSPNDLEYNKADDNRNTSTGGNDWYLTDEITTEPFKIEFSNADESVSKHPTEDSIDDEFQSEETNVDLVTSSTISYLSTTSNEKISKKCKTLITTTTESNWLNWWTNDNKKADKESTECEEDVTSLPTTSDSIEEETSYYSTSVSDDFSIYNTISTLDSTTLTWEYFSKEDKNVSDEEISTTYSMIKDEENNKKKVMISKSMLNEESDKNNEETQSWESTTHSRGTTHNVNLDLNSEEEEDRLDKSISDEDNEIDNGIVEIIEDYEIDNCNETQHACDKYTCIDEDQVCDGIVDCLNANDETDCDYIYSKRWEEHQRINNKRIDFTSNTVDMSHLDGCSPFEHPCDSMCINALHVCDGKRDCLDDTDEENCTKGIPHVENNILREASHFTLCSRCKKYLALDGASRESQAIVTSFQDDLSSSLYRT
ncbi:SCO-spondin [Trachymyrmex cornetzi]|uniref:SCO-spondin n=1 Tax=Trachymyrmex cornetzi TaxID=471704 RepID=A0A195E3X1_9HYME|nr:SCO-spondin [Trachymyrmex cornetzi]